MRDRHGVGNIQCFIAHHARHDSGDQDVEERANHQRAQDSDGHVALRIFRFLRRGGDGIEADVGEEDGRGSGGDASNSKTVPDPLKAECKGAS